MQRVTHRRSHPFLCSSKGLSFLFMSLLAFSPTPLLSHPCSLLLLLHAALFSLIGLHLFLYPPTLHADSGEEISLTLYLRYCSLFPSLSVFLLICLPLSLSLLPSLPPSLPLSLTFSSLSLHTDLIHFTHYRSIHHFVREGKISPFSFF